MKPGLLIWCEIANSGSIRRRLGEGSKCLERLKGLRFMMRSIEFGSNGDEELCGVRWEGIDQDGDT